MKCNTDTTPTTVEDKVLSLAVNLSTADVDVRDNHSTSQLKKMTHTTMIWTTIKRRKTTARRRLKLDQMSDRPVFTTKGESRHPSNTRKRALKNDTQRSSSSRTPSSSTAKLAITVLEDSRPCTERSLTKVASKLSTQLPCIKKTRSHVKAKHSTMMRTMKKMVNRRIVGSKAEKNTKSGTLRRNMEARHKASSLVALSSIATITSSKLPTVDSLTIRLSLSHVTERRYLGS
jgi:hypothetical protein